MTPTDWEQYREHGKHFMTAPLSQERINELNDMSEAELVEIVFGGAKTYRERLYAGALLRGEQHKR